MQIDFLAAQGFSPATIDNWKAAGKASLLPLQAEAVTRTLLLHGGNVAVFAPTSSGKTFVAELAAVRHLEHGRKAVFLVPTKALAEEQFRYLEQTYAPVGARVAIATRERTSHDARIVRGEFDFAVMVYEKLKAFLTLAPELLSRISMVAVDELQILGEPGRGDLVDMLLTRIVHAEPRIQVVCLSAVLGENLRLASWLKAEVLTSTERPTELREGVFCLQDSKFYYREANDGGEAVEDLLADEHAPPAGWSIVPEPEEFQYPAVEVLASVFVARGEQLLIFVPTRDMSRRWAYRLANALPLGSPASCRPDAKAAQSISPDAADPLTTLAAAEESHSRELMERCMQSGVAFHNADLGTELRALVEAQFQSGAIRVLVATSTLAQGVNLNCRNVISIPVMLDPTSNAGARPAFVPLAVQRFRNQGGRAGRLCSGEPFGRSILIAQDAAELQRLMQQYVHADVEPLQPRIGADVLDRLVLEMIHVARGRDVDAIQKLLLETYSAATYWSAKPAQLYSAIVASVKRLVEAHLVQENAGGRLAATGLGQIAAAFGLQAGTLQMFSEFCAVRADGGASELEVLALCAFSPDGELFPVTVSQREGADQFYPRLLKHRYGTMIYSLPDSLRVQLAPDGGFSGAGMAALKRIFLADAWISADATHAIEEQFKTFAGTFANLGAHFSWLTQALASCMATLGVSADGVKQVSEIADRLAWGASAAGLELARMNVPGLTRTHVQQLVRAGYDTAQAILDLQLEQLSEIIPATVAEKLRVESQRICNATERSNEYDWFSILEQWNAAQKESLAAPTLGAPASCRQKPQVVQTTSSKRSRATAGMGESIPVSPIPLAAETVSPYLTPTPDLIIDPRSPGEIEFHGKRLKLTPKPFELLLLLAQNPGRTIPYAEIDASLWPDTKVEAQQRSAHKVTLTRQLATICGAEQADKLVVNIPRFGIRFDLAPERIQVGKLRSVPRGAWSGRAECSAGASHVSAAPPS